jgi:hypothetical protein
MLALRAGDHQPTIAAIEAGRRDVRVGHLERLVARAGCRLSLIPTTAEPVAEAAAGIAEFLAGGDVDSAWRAFIQANDDLSGAGGCAGRSVRVRADPDRRSTIRRLFGSAGLPPARQCRAAGARMGRRFVQVPG